MVLFSSSCVADGLEGCAASDAAPCALRPSGMPLVIEPVKPALKSTLSRTKAGATGDGFGHRLGEDFAHARISEVARLGHRESNLAASFDPDHDIDIGSRSL
jgi:hypothetical protein